LAEDRLIRLTFASVNFAIALRDPGWEFFPIIFL